MKYHFIPDFRGVHSYGVRRVGFLRKSEADLNEAERKFIEEEKKFRLRANQEKTPDTQFLLAIFDLIESQK